jgi:hypothetical protein
MRLFAESDVTMLTDPTIDRQYPFPINSKLKEYRTTYGNRQIGIAN